jgi:hypothetical protein
VKNVIAVLNLIAIHLGDLVTSTKDANALARRMLAIVESHSQSFGPRPASERCVKRPLTRIEACVQGKCQCKPGKRR